MRFFEYRSQEIYVSETPGRLETILTAWGSEGWEVFSVIVPDPRNYSTFVATAKREILSQRTPATGRKFR